MSAPKPPGGLYLVEPHPSYIHMGVKTLIVKTRNFKHMLNKELILLGAKAYGTIKLKNVKKISLAKFKRLRQQHRISEAEREEWAKAYRAWRDGPFFAYEFEYKPFKKPRDYKRPRGVQTFLQDVIMKAELEKMKKPFASPMGKTKQLPILLKLIPPHRTYVEPFAGGATLYYGKEPSQREVLNDLEKDIADTLKFFKTATPAMVQNLKRRRWSPDKSEWQRIKQWKPATISDRAYKHLYLLRHSYGAYNPGFRAGPPTPPQCLDAIQKYRQRMKNTIITAKDWKQCVKRWDAEDTFFYLDPPYFYWDKEKQTAILEELHKVLPKLKGKWLLNFSDTPTAKQFFSDYHIKRYKVERPIGGIHETGFQRKYELAIMNYDYTQLRKAEDLILKPKGPWGEGFPECVAWVKRRKGWSTERARRYCGAIHQQQRGRRKAQTPHIEFLGTRGLVDEKSEGHSHHSSLLLDSGRTRILIDWGQTHQDQELPRDLDAIIITHAHPDHLFGLQGRTVKTPVYNTDASLHSKYYKVQDYNVTDNWKVLKRSSTLKIGDISLTSVPISHSTLAPNIALFIEIDGYNICYASDILNLKVEHRERHLEQCDLYIGDLSTLKKSGLIRWDKKRNEAIGHASPHQQMKWAEAAGVRKVIFTHLGGEPIKTGDTQLMLKLNAISEQIGIEAAIATDGKIVELKPALLRKAVTLQQLERIDAKYVAELSDRRLQALDEEVHALARKLGRVNEELLNAHIFIWREFEERNIQHEIEDELTRETRFWIIEYPPPTQKMLTLNEVIDAFPQTLKLPKPDLKIYLCGGLVNRGWVTGQDIDIRINSNQFLPEVKTAILHQVNDNHIREKLGFIFDEEGGIGHSILLYDDGVKKADIQPFRPTQPMKPTSGTEYTTEEALYHKWAAARIDRGILIQPKMDGMCQPPGNLIITKEAAKPIEAVNENDCLYTEGGEFTTIRETWVRNYTGSIVKINPVYLPPSSFTPEHPIKVIEAADLTRRSNWKRRKPSWKPAAAVSKSDYLIIPKPKWNRETPAKLDLAKFLSEDFRVRRTTKITINKIQTNRSVIPRRILVTEDLLRLLGWYLAEGSVNTRYGNISFALSETESREAEWISKTLKEIFGLNSRTRIKDGGREVYLRNKALAFFLASFGANSKTKRIPGWVKHLEEDLLKILINSYLSGDGCKQFNSLTTASRGLAADLQLVLLSLGQVWSFSQTEAPPRVIKGRSTPPSIRFTLSKIHGRHSRWFKEDNDHFYFPIREVIIEEYSGPVYNFETKSHTYAVPFLVHNSFQIHKSGDKIAIYTEDQLRDRSAAFRKSVPHLKRIRARQAVIAAEMVEYTDEVINPKAKNPWEKYRQIPREDLVKWIAAKPANLDDENVVFHLHDLLYLNGKPLLNMNAKDRYYALKKITPQSRHYHVVDTWEASSKGAFDTALHKARHYPNSEGAMLKTADSTYKVDVKNPQRTRDWCITGGSYLLGERGFMMVKNIKPDDKVFSKDGRLHRVLAVAKRRILPGEKLFDLKPANGFKIRLTGNHEILTNPAGWIPAEEFRDQKLEFPKLIVPKQSAPEVLELNWHGYKKRIVCDKDFWRLIGFWVAEGEIGSSRNQLYHRGQFGLGQKDRAILEKYTRIWREKFLTEPSIYRYPNTVSLLKVWDKPFCDWLSENFLDEEGNKTLPWFMAALEPEKFQSFLDGYLEGDGYFNRKRVSSSDHALAGRLFAILLSRGMNVSVGYQKPHIGKGSFRINWKKTSRSIQWLKEVKTDGRDVIYDLQIENEDSYLSPGLVLHNSKIKNLKSIDVMVFDPHPVKDAPGVYTYQCYIGPLTEKQLKMPWRKRDLKQWKGKWFLRIGTSYNVKAKLPEGSILEVRPIRIELVEREI